MIQRRFTRIGTAIGPAIRRAVGFALAGSIAAAQASVPPTAIRADAIAAHIQALASDEFEGRAPGTSGEEKTIAYLTAAFRSLGLEPGNPDGTFVQRVPMVGLAAEPTLVFRAGELRLEPKFRRDFVAATRRVQERVDVSDSPVVFVGYGVVAPEYGWDDYKGVDVAGKTVVMLVGDPPVPKAGAGGELDSAVFKGAAMTYYGRWTYKYEIATEKKAAAVLIVHETGPAGYPWAVVGGSFGRENMDIDTPDGNAGRVAIEGWIERDRAVELFSACGKDYDAEKRAAATREFRPVELGARADLSVTSVIRKIASQNAVALLRGSDPALRDEYVVYTAHWDHLGRDPALEGDQIFNGALDNATGTAGLLELARALAARVEKPKRSILFLAVTAEEKGLLGSKYYAAQPLYPLERTLADVNMDGLNVWGRTRDVSSLGIGQTTLEDQLVELATGQGRTVVGDPEPEKGMFYRSDHFEFAKLGVPALYLKSGIDYAGKPEGFGRAKRDEFTARDYHKVSDEPKPDWDLSGAAEDLELLLALGAQVANGERWPEWKPGTEFRAVREKRLAAARR